MAWHLGSAWAELEPHGYGMVAMSGAPLALTAGVELCWAAAMLMEDRVPLEGAAPNPGPRAMATPGLQSLRSP